MSAVISFATGDQAILVEVESSASRKSSGVAKAGLASALGDQILAAKLSLEEALSGALKANVGAFSGAIAALDKLPSEWSVEFGLKMTGEFGNVVVSKVSAEANYTVKLTWKAETAGK